ncbi:MAG TPA: acyl-CoA dehydrogenase family protein, partial [Tepidiformaceae bacterium]|nr:acyl-CoA dehydrogenase family protein [Tepidiformaceae bacterium]
DLLATFRSRAAKYDRENSFFVEDFEDLKRIGYLKMVVPEEFGGRGFTLAQAAREQRRLAEYAPATALAVNMHVYWTGVAADMRRMGDASLEWLLREAGQGEVFAAGHGESGNDLPLFLSTSRAERADGGYRFYGHKIFGSLSPVWTRLGLHGMDTSDPANPKIVHAFLPRSAQGYTIKETWDTLGMRATRSDDTILDGAFVPDRYVSRVIGAGQADLFVLCVFAWGLGGFAGVYTGLARRALDLAVATAHKRTSLALSRSMAYHPEVQHNVAEMVMTLEAIDAQFERLIDDWSAGADYGHNWPMKIVAAKHNAVEGAKSIVDKAMAISGGSGMFKGQELERLYRDVRAGGFHPANTLLAYEIVGKIGLGIDLGEQPRWG